MASQGLPSPGSPRVCLYQRLWSRPTSPSSPFHLSCYFLDLQTQPAVQGRPSAPWAYGTRPWIPHTHLVDGSWRPGIRSGGLGMEEGGIRGEGRRSFLPISHLQACSPHPNPLWALFPTLVSLAPLTDDPVPTLLLVSTPRFSLRSSEGDRGSSG